MVSILVLLLFAKRPVFAKRPSINETQVRGLIYVWNTLEGETLFIAILTIIVYFNMALQHNSEMQRRAVVIKRDHLDSNGA